MTTRLISILIGEYTKGILEPPEGKTPVVIPKFDKLIPLPAGARMLGLMAATSEGGTRFGLELLADPKAPPVSVRVVVIYGRDRGQPQDDADGLEALTYAGAIDIPAAHTRAYAFYDAGSLPPAPKSDTPPSSPPAQMPSLDQDDSTKIRRR